MRAAILSLVCAGMLCGCYTNLNQQWLRQNQEYRSYRVSYRWDDEHRSWEMIPALYRRGEEWYIAAISSVVEDLDRRVWVQRIDSSYDTRHDFYVNPSQSSQIMYHRLTPEYAALLLHAGSESENCFTPEQLMKSLSLAGGDWLTELPAEVQVCPAEFLKQLGGAQIELIEPLPAASSWFTYPMVGLTFLCVDIPATILVNFSSVGGLLIPREQGYSSEE